MRTKGCVLKSPVSGDAMAKVCRTGALVALGLCGTNSGFVGPPVTVMAIVGGVEAGSRLANVGIVVGRFEAGAEWHWLGCNGTLIAKDVVLTVAHCVVPRLETVVEFGVAFTPAIPIVQGDFEPTVPLEVPVYAGTVYYHPNFNVDAHPSPVEDSFDLAVVKLAEVPVGLHAAQVVGAEHFEIFRAAYEHLGIGLTGYGNTSFLPFIGTAPLDWGVKRFTTGRVDTVYPAKVIVAPAPGQICGGDSGGPGFPATLHDIQKHPVAPYVNQINSVVSFTVLTETTLPCETASIMYRLDTPQARAFLGQFIPL